MPKQHTMSEDLPTPEKSIQQNEKEQMQRLKEKAKKGKDLALVRGIYAHAIPALRLCFIKGSIRRS